MPHTRLTIYLDEQQIPYTITEHAPIFTVAEGKDIERGTVGAHSKNLFVRDKKKTVYYLISVLNHKRVDLKALAQRLGSTKLSFASPEDLDALLGLIPGSVTPFGLINDRDKKVSFVLDDEFLAHELCNFHPLRNDMTITVTSDHLMLFCRSLGYEPLVVDIPTIE